MLKYILWSHFKRKSSTYIKIQLNWKLSLKKAQFFWLLSNDYETINVIKHKIFYIENSALHEIRCGLYDPLALQNSSYDI